MGIEEGEIVELERSVSAEIPELESFEERYRSAASAFTEENFPGGADSVYSGLPDKAQALPRYIDPPHVSESYLMSLSDQAAYAINFAELRSKNLSCAVEELEEGDYLVLHAGERSVRSDELRGVLEGYQSSLQALETDLIGVARFLDASEDLPGKPFNEMKHLYQTGGTQDRKAAKKAESDEFDFPVENYWPFGSREPEGREQLN